MKLSKSLVLTSLLASSALTACQGNLPTATLSQSTSAVEAKAIPLTQLSPTTQASRDMIDLGDTSTPEILSGTEMNAVKQLIAQAEAKVAAEDAGRTVAAPSFKTMSADQGKDVDIELFLYHPKYGSKAKSWGIDNAHDFLQAGRSPWRRWILRLKLEGLFAPKDFSRQLLFWVEQADLLRLKDVNRDQAWLLVANGITSVPDLARRGSIELGALMVSMKISALTYGIDAPGLEELKDWANEAQGLDPVIY